MEEAIVTVYDPIAMQKVEKVYGDKIDYAASAEKALEKSETAFILTEWDEIKHLSLEKIQASMAQPILFDGRNCFLFEEAEKYGIQYFSIGIRDVVR